MMERMWASLKDKKFRYGTLSTVMILFAVAIFVLTNLVVDQFNFTRDLTRDQMFSLSPFSKDYLANELDQEITIYALFRTGQEHLMLKQILEQYDASSPFITVEYRDPLLYPTFVEQFATQDERVMDNSVIVVSSKKHKVISPNDMFTYDIDYNTWQQYLVSIDFEPQISKAIQFVTLDDAPVVYHAMGSGEFPLPENLIKLFEIENYEYREVDLVLGELPEDCDILLLSMPGRDWSSDKANRILEYLQNEGRALFLLGFQMERFTNLDNVLSAYGVGIGDYIVLEGDTNRFYLGNPAFVVPTFKETEITQPIMERRFANLFPETTGIDELTLRRGSTVIEPFLVTTASAYGKNNPEPESINKEPGDLDGPFSLAVMVTDTWFTHQAHETKFVAFSCRYILEESINDMIGGTNWDIIMNSLHWLSDQPTSIFIPSKSPTSVTALQMTQAQANTIALVAVFAMPLFFVAAGVFVWYRRRHS